MLIFVGVHTHTHIHTNWKILILRKLFFFKICCLPVVRLTRKIFFLFLISAFFPLVQWKVQSIYSIWLIAHTSIWGQVSCHNLLAKLMKSSIAVAKVPVYYASHWKKLRGMSGNSDDQEDVRLYPIPSLWKPFC